MSIVIYILSILSASGFLAVQHSPETDCSDSFYVKGRFSWIQDCELAEKRRLKVSVKSADSGIVVILSEG